MPGDRRYNEGAVTDRKRNQHVDRYRNHRSETVVRKQPSSVTPHNLMTDKFHEECGVAAIYGHPEASKLAYLSLYALQHRGQESGGISVSNGKAIQTTKF